jgi:adenylylsulfate kinase
MKILIMGLPGSGKTTLAKELIKLLPNSEWFNADTIRQQYNDWDFSVGGRLRQCERMKTLANTSNADYVICDFIAPTNAIREQFNADFLVFVDTQDSSKYDDTNKLFEKPQSYNIRVDSKHAIYWANQIKNILK